MASLLSPGVISREIDLTTATPAVASTEGGIALDTQWGPADKLVLVTDELDLVEFFGKPNSVNAARWFTAKNFLSYSTALYVSRAVNSTTYNATNHTSAENLQIKNSDSFESMSLDGVSSLFAAKYAGSRGNTLKVSFADNSTYDTWPEKSNFSGKPDLDELHIAIIDEDGLFSGSKGTLLEKYEFVSKFSDAKNEDGSSNYYKQVVNDKSEYIYVLQHDPLMTGWGKNSSDYLDFNSTTGVATHKSDGDGGDKSDEIMLTSVNDTFYSLDHGTDGTVSSADLESAYDLFEDEELVDISFLIVGPDTLDNDNSSPLVQKVYDIVLIINF